jgi:hypothetical protein
MVIKCFGGTLSIDQAPGFERKSCKLNGELVRKAGRSFKSKSGLFARDQEKTSSFRNITSIGLFFVFANDLMKLLKYLIRLRNRTKVSNGELVCKIIMSLRSSTDAF